jgi:hypothetical protein
VELVDLRQNGPVLDEVRSRGLNPDEGMVLIYGGRYIHGADCIHQLALLSTPSDLFNRLNAFIFRSPLLSRALYPVLRQGRSVALFLLARPRFGQDVRGAKAVTGTNPVQSYRRYRSLVVLTPALLLLYAIVAVAWKPISPPDRVQAELFPFFNWSLFSTPRREFQLITVRITEVSGPDERGAPLVGQLLDPSAASFLQDTRFRKVARTLARASDKEGKQSERVQAMLGNFLRPYGVTAYDLVSLTYDPLEYYEGTGAPVETVIGHFELEGDR